MSSKVQSGVSSESDFDFIETPKAPAYVKPEDYGVKTTSVRSCLLYLPTSLSTPVDINWNPTDILNSSQLLKTHLCPQMVLELNPSLISHSLV